MNSRAGPPLRSTPRPDLSSFLTQQVLALIRGGGLGPGDRLPSAEALAERFAVATPTLREALRRLQATGVIDIRHGSGIYVRHGQERFVLANPHHAGLNRHALLHLLDARLLIEPHLAELAAQHATEADLGALAQILAEAEEYLVDHDEQLHRANMAFHAAIAHTSSNVVLRHVIESLIELYSSEQMAIQWLYDARPRDHEQHLRVLAAIRAGDPARARERMAEHISDVKVVVETSLAAAQAGDGPGAKA